MRDKLLHFIVLVVFVGGWGGAVVWAEESDFQSGLRFFERQLSESRNRFILLSKDLISGDMLTKMERGIELSTRGDYEQASIVFGDIVDNHERKENNAAYLTSEFYLARSLFHLGYYGRAQSLLLDVVAQGYGKEQEEAGHLLLDVVQQTEDWEPVVEVLLTVWSRFTGTPSGDVFAYILSRSYFLRGDLEESRKFSDRLPSTGEWSLKGTYIRGAISVKREDYDDALSNFRRVVEYPDTDAANFRDFDRLRDLSYMAMARIYYAQDQLSQALDYYERVSERSPYFDTVLFEAAWTHIRREEADEARRSFELLALSFPHSRYADESRRMSYDLARFLGHYDEAMRGYHVLLEEHEPVLEKMQKLDESAVRSRFSEEFRDGASFGSRVFDGNLLYQNIDGGVSGRLTKMSDALRVSVKNQEVSTELIGELEEVVDSELKMSIFPEYFQLWRNRRQILLGMLILRSRFHDDCMKTHRLSSSMSSSRRALDKELRGLPQSVDDVAAHERRTERAVNSRKERLHLLKLEIHNLRKQNDILKKWLHVDGHSLIVQSADRATKVEESERLEVLLGTMEARAMEIERDIRRKEGISGINIDDLYREEELFSQLSSTQSREWQDFAGKGCDESFTHRYTTLWQDVEGYGGELEKGVDVKLARFKMELAREKERYLAEQARLSRASSNIESSVTDAGYVYWQKVLAYVYGVVKGADSGMVDVSWMRKSEKSKTLGEVIEKRNRDREEVEQDFQRFSQESGQSGVGIK